MTLPPPETGALPAAPSSRAPAPAPALPRSPSRVGAVAIGRNEGARLIACLTSLIGTVDRLVYVDSGSTDDSVARAREMGVEVVELDRSAPFTAARGRNAGFAALQTGAPVDYVQFVDGDCTVVTGYIDKAARALDANPDWAIVTGWREEMSRSASVYNEMCDVEWHRPPGEIRACGGDLMVRSGVFIAVGGFNAGIIASEDEDFVLRVRAAGHMAWRLPERMTVHDMAMFSIRQWWRRNVRTGHGFAEVGALHQDHFVAERRRVWFYGAVIPVLVALAFVLPVWLELRLIALLFVLSWGRTAIGLTRTGQPTGEAARHAFFYTLAKLPQLQGMLTYYWRRLRGHRSTIIEYK